ncbi:MAG: hypothetical protein GX969_00365 [Firmicutes bacterium]|nr:hypothetical protein [Bacillota bacterium]
MNHKSKLLTTFLILILLSAGLSYAYFSIKVPDNTNKTKEKLSGLTKLDYPGSIPWNGLKQTNISSANPTKINSRTEILYRTLYQCGHGETHQISAPPEMIGLSRDELAKQIEPWSITEFSEDQVILFQKRQGISPICLQNMHIGEKDGWVTVFYGTPDNRCRPKSTTRIRISGLPPGELDDLKAGIRVSDEEELLHILEALASWADG